MIDKEDVYSKIVEMWLTHPEYLNLQMSNFGNHRKTPGYTTKANGVGSKQERLFDDGKKDEFYERIRKSDITRLYFEYKRKPVEQQTPGLMLQCFGIPLPPTNTHKYTRAIDGDVTNKHISNWEWLE